MQTELQIRRIAPADNTAIRNLYTAVFNPIAFDLNGDVARLAESYFNESLSQDLADAHAHYSRDPRVAFFLADSSGTLAGMCGVDLWQGDETIAELRRVAVRADCRRKGIGRRLLNEAEEWARAQGFRAMRFHTVDLFREAIAMYESSGFRLVQLHNWGAVTGREYEKKFERGNK